MNSFFGIIGIIFFIVVSGKFLYGLSERKFKRIRGKFIKFRDFILMLTILSYLFAYITKIWIIVGFLMGISYLLITYSAVVLAVARMKKRK